MNIQEAQRCLGTVAADALRERILAQEDSAWNEHLLRQEVYDVHRETESIVMLFCDESWPEGEIHREPGWERQWPWEFDPFDRLAVVDYGDCLFDHGRPEGVPAEIEAQAQTILDAGSALLSLGGDHFVTYPLLRALLTFVALPGLSFLLKGWGLRSWKI